jgi:hypothetical protein
MATTNQMSFRQWVHELWLENCDEHMLYQELPYSQQDYFQRYKYWLKREYRHQMKARDVR